MARSAPRRHGDFHLVPASPNEFADSWFSARPEAVFISMGEPLFRLIGRDGYRALLERALHIASEEYPELKTVRAALVPAGRLIGVRPPEASGNWAEAVGAVLNVLLTLLAQFIGSDLLEQVLCEAGGGVWAPRQNDYASSADPSCRVSA